MIKVKMMLKKNDDLEYMLGAPEAAIRHMIVPFLISIIVVQINVFADTFWVSGLGIDAVSGMTSAVPMYSIFVNIGIGLSVGVVATIAYRIGKGDRKTASNIAGSAIISAILLSVICSVIVFFLTDPIIDIMGAQDVRSQIKDYMLPFIFLSPILVLNTVFGGLLRAEGSAKRSTIVQMSAAIFNMILDPLLIYGLGFGLMGAGLATVLASCFGLIIAIYWYVRKRTVISIGKEDFTFRTDIQKELMTVAGPRTLEGMVMSVVILFQRVFIIVASGTVGVSLFNVPFRYVALSMCPSEATGMAMVPIAAAAYGQDDLQKMKKGMIYALKLAMIFSLVLMVFLFIFSDPLISLFTMEESMQEWKYAFLWNMRMYCIILPFFTIQTIGSSMLQAMKRSKRPMEITMILGVVRLLLFWIASGFDYQAITYALIFSYVLSAILMIFMARYEFGKLCSISAEPVPTS